MRNSPFRRLAVFLLPFIGFLFLLPSSCVPGRNPSLLRVGVQELPDSLIATRIDSLSGILVASQSFEGLVKVDPASNAVLPCLAESWTRDDDGAAYVFRLAPAVWSDGAPVTARDVRESWLAMMDPRMKASFGWFPALFLAGGMEFSGLSGDADPAVLAAAREAVGLKAVDDRTLQVRLKAPDAGFLRALGHFSFWVLPEGLRGITAPGDPAPGSLVASGPFLPAVRDGDSLVARANPLYRNSESQLLRELRFMPVTPENLESRWKAGELDHVPRLPPGADTGFAGKDAVRRVPDLASYYFVFHVRRKGLDDLRIRQALVKAVDTVDLVQNLLGNDQIPVGGVLPDLAGLSALPPVPPDPAGAADLVAAAGYGTGKPLSLHLVINRNDANMMVADYLAARWNALPGIKVTVESLDMDEFLARQEEGDFDIIRSGWQGLFPEALPFLERFRTGHGLNDPGLSIPELDARLDAMAREADLSTPEGYKSLRDAENLLLSAVPVIPLFQYSHEELLRPGIWNAPVPLVPGGLCYGDWKVLHP